MTILLTCRRCKGSGVVPNEQFRICQELKSQDIKKYFHMPTEEMVSDDDLTEQNGCNTVTETMTCPVCAGRVPRFRRRRMDSRLLPMKKISLKYKNTLKYGITVLNKNLSISPEPNTSQLLAENGTILLLT